MLPSQGMEQVFLVKQGEGGCSSSVFRLSLVLGGLLLLLGVVAFVVAAFAARRTVVVGEVRSSLVFLFPCCSLHVSVEGTST